MVCDKICIGLILLTIRFMDILALKCVCNPKDCDVIRSEDCPGKGVILWDPCKCCRMCAKTVGESCGGPNGFSGTCETPLQCISKPSVELYGICMDFPNALLNTNCDKKFSLEPGCEIVNGKCKCWQRLKRCKHIVHHWSYRNLKECKLNLQRVIRKRYTSEYLSSQNSSKIR